MTLSRRAKPTSVTLATVAMRSASALVAEIAAKLRTHAIAGLSPNS